MHRASHLGPQWQPFGGDVSAGGLVGTLSGDYLLANFNTMGAMLATAAYPRDLDLSGFQFLDGEARQSGSPVPWPFLSRIVKQIRKLARHSPSKNVWSASACDAAKRSSVEAEKRNAARQSRQVNPTIDTEPIPDGVPAPTGQTFDPEPQAATDRTPAHLRR